MKKDEIPVEQQLIYNVEEVATLLKTTRPVVYSLIEKGYLPSIVLGRRKVTRKALLTFLDKNENTDFNSLLKIKLPT
jgi:excisionase family DNA binding protein